MTQNRKTYVLDTSVLLAEGKEALYAFKGQDVVVPLPVVRELEAKKNDPMVGFLARSVLRAIEALREKHGSDLTDGVQTDGDGGTIRIEVNHVSYESVPEALKRDPSNDARILVVTHNLAKEVGAKNTILVSNDLTMRLIAEVSVGVHAEEFRHQSTQGNYSGMIKVQGDKQMVDTLYQKDALVSIDTLDLATSDLEGHNVGAVVRGVGSQSALVCINGKNVTTIADPVASGIRGRSAEQKVALHHLLDPERKIVSLGGSAGTGKTFLAIAAGIEQTIEPGSPYNRIIIYRPLQEVGGDKLGALPGTLEEKMEPWAAAVFDALDNMTTVTDGRNFLTEDLLAKKQLEVIPVAHIRGRSLNNAFIIIEEAQNLDRNVILSVLSRLGEGSKAVLSWDAAQSDNLHIGRHDGVVAIVDKFREEALFSHTTLIKSERSDVAEVASRILDDFLT